MEDDAIDELLREFWNIPPGDPDASKRILSIYERAGGVETFKEKAISHHLIFLRNCVVGAWEFPQEAYLELFKALKKPNRDDVYMFATNRLIISNGEVFSKLWALNKTMTFTGLTRVVDILMENNDHILARTREQVPALNGIGHHIITHGGEARKFFEGVRQGVMKAASPELLSILETEALKLSTVSKEDYAASVLVHAEHWRPLLADKRTVISALAKNPLLPEEIAYEIMNAHKSPGLREDIASNAASEELLEYIWKSTKSKTIRRAVAANGLSGRHIRNPEALSIW